MIPRISRNAVKEGFDTLPAAICYFDRNGLLRLINHRMQEIAAVLCGRDLQTLTDLEQALRSPGGGVRLRDEAARIYEFPDGTVYHFTVRPVQDKYGIPYTEVMATDVTQLATLHAAHRWRYTPAGSVRRARGWRVPQGTHRAAVRLHPEQPPAFAYSSAGPLQHSPAGRGIAGRWSFPTSQLRS